MGAGALGATAERPSKQRQNILVSTFLPPSGLWLVPPESKKAFDTERSPEAGNLRTSRKK